MALNFLKNECIYTSCYCEENVWHLCKRVQENVPELLPECYAVFISNGLQAVPLWCQAAGDNAHGLVQWDYHVIFIHRGKKDCFVYDLDTTLPFPVHFEEYQLKTLRDDGALNPRFRRYFRVISAQEFLQTFASDRRHMKKLGLWIKPPPNYDPIKTPVSNHNLEKFISMNPGEGPGNVMSCMEFLTKFRVIAT